MFWITLHALLLYSCSPASCAHTHIHTFTCTENCLKFRSRLKGRLFGKVTVYALCVAMCCGYPWPCGLDGELGVEGEGEAGGRQVRAPGTQGQPREGETDGN